ncbi:Condensin complex subunit 3 [Schistosoma japonicum]|nr:Condensin complex subunit 3 [Schistosoma japonicum]
MDNSAVGNVSGILEVFEECQLSGLSHDRLCIKLKNIYDNTRFTHFADDFFELCRYSLVSGERSSYRERTIDFITKFALFCGKSENSNQDTLNNRLLLKLFLFCIKYNECSNPAVRFRCMQIIHKLLDGIGDNGIMPEELYRTLQNMLLRRVYDTKVSVRVEAIQALSPFIWLTRHDPTAEVRRAALAAMVLTTRTLPSLVERCRDLADNVRRAAYKLLASRGILRPLSIAKRIRILQDGLSDRSEEVRKATKELVLAWFNGSNRDPVLLLRRLDPESDPGTSQKALDSLFEVLSSDDLLKVVQEWYPNYLNSDRILKPDCLTPEATFFWRALVEFIHKKEISANNSVIKSSMQHEDVNEESNSFQRLADLVQPSVSVYVDLAKSAVDKLVQAVLAQEFDEKAIEQECVVEQILSMAGSLDLSDEFGRRRLVSLVHDWITNQQVSGTLAPQLLKLHAILEPNLRRRVDNVVEMISELCDPVEPHTSSSSVSVSTMSNENHCPTKDAEPTNQPVLSKKKEINIRLKIASLEVRMNELNEALHDCVSRKEFERATELRDACNKLDIERTELLQELHGHIAISTDKPLESPSDSSEENKVDNKEALGIENFNGIANCNKNDEDDDNNKVDAAEDAIQHLFQRCSSSVLFKANRMAALVVQQSPTLWSLPASLRSLLDSLILPSMQHSDVAVRNQAILALGLCCTMDLPLTLQYIHVFYSAMRVDHLMICETALGCIIDCLLLYGFRPFHDANINPNARILPTNTIVIDDDDDDEQDFKAPPHDYVVLTRQTFHDSNTSTNQSSNNNTQGTLVRCDEMSRTAYRLLKPITSLLEGEYDDGLRSASALGLAKLLIYDRIVSSHILSLLLLLWFNPVSEESPQLRHGLALFFSDYACANGVVAFEHQSALTDAVLPTLATLIRAPASSPLSEVEPNVVASLLARLTDTTYLKSQIMHKNAENTGKVNDGDEDARLGVNKSKPISVGTADEKINNPHHDRLVSVLSTEVLKAPQSAEAKLYLRMIFQLRPSTENKQVHKELLKLVDSMSLNLMLHRFRKQLVAKSEHLGIDPAKLDESTVSQNNNDRLDTPPYHNDDDDSNHTLVNNEQSQPTLLGSARVNFHLVHSSEHLTEKTQGYGTMIFNQSNKNQSVDKSSHQNLLDFSDEDDDDDVDCDATHTSLPRISSPVKYKPKKNPVSTRRKNVATKDSDNISSVKSSREVFLQSSDNESLNSSSSSSTTVKLHPVVAKNSRQTTTTRSGNNKKLKHSQKKVAVSSPASINSSKRLTRSSTIQKSTRRL